MFSREYDKLSDEKKIEVNTALGRLFKKLISGDAAAAQNFEKDMGDILKTLQGGMVMIPDTTLAPTTPTTTAPSTDPYSFDLPTVTPTEPTPTAQQPSEYDF
jgi:hypothetical protein